MRRPGVISLFTGAGGIDFGLEAAGFETRVAIEMNADCCETLRANRPWPVIERSIFQISTKEMLGVAGLAVGDIDLLAGGPPCQPFSKSSYWVRGHALRLSDSRARTLDAFMRVAEEALPRVILLENVEGFAYRDGDEGLQLILKRLNRINARHGTRYAVTHGAIQCASYGVPQTRVRRILVASRDGKAFVFPNETHGNVGELEPFRTAWDALGNDDPEEEGLELKGKWADLLPSIPEGENYLWHTNRGGGLPLFGWRRRYWTFLLKLAKARPSWTIQAKPGPSAGPFHWNNRRLSISELCRLQTFPGSVKIRGGRISAHSQVGNAVPSLLAEVIGRSVRAQLLGLPVLRGPLQLLPGRRLPRQRMTPRRPVPMRYYELIGAHPDHPGEGKGPGARERGRARSAA